MLRLAVIAIVVALFAVAHLTGSLELPRRAAPAPTSAATRGLVDKQALQLARALDADVLNPLGLKVVRTQDCGPYLDWMSSAYQAQISRAQKKKRITEAVQSAADGRCVVEMSGLERMPKELRAFYLPRRERLLDTPACAQYGKWAEDLAFGKYSQDEKRIGLSKLFVTALEHECVR